MHITMLITIPPISLKCNTSFGGLVPGKNIYFGGPSPKKRWANYKKIANERFKKSISAMILYAISKTFNLDPDTGEALPSDSTQVADAPKKK